MVIKKLKINHLLFFSFPEEEGKLKWKTEEFAYSSCFLSCQKLNFMGMT